jgi:hypothetical protein
MGRNTKMIVEGVVRESVVELKNYVQWQAFINTALNIQLFQTILGISAR